MKFLHSMQTRLYPKLIQDVQLIISELGSITVLWEDQWLSTLQDLHPGMIYITFLYSSDTFSQYSDTIQDGILKN